ncbi:MAG: Smr/MutS family protein [Bacteroidia bacterium]
MFQPNDKVSFINDRLNGIVKHRTGANQVMVLLDDGFEIPVSETELVLVSREKKEEKPTAETGEQYATPRAELEEKMYLAFALDKTKNNNPQVKAYFLNNSSAQVQFVCFNASQPNSIKVVASGGLDKATSQHLVSFPLEQAESYKIFRLQILRYISSSQKILPPADITVKIRETSLLKENQDITFLGQKGLLVPIEFSESNAKSTFTSEIDDKDELPAILEDVPEIVDLHIEGFDIKEGNESVMAESILRSQLENFRNMLEKAIAANKERIIFIHGVGNGTLKMEIQKVLMRNKYVSRWEEADTKKFGNGATAVYLKSR